MLNKQRVAFFMGSHSSRVGGLKHGVILVNIIKISKKDECEACIYDSLVKFVKDTDKGWNYITPEDLHKKGLNKFFILDIREPEVFKEGHLKGATNIFWLNLLEEKNLNKLPTNKKILIVCYVGHTASQMLVALKLLGYDAVVLKFGMGKSPVEGVPVAGWLDFGFEVEKGA